MRRHCENKCGTEPAYAKVKLKMTLDEWMEWAVPRYEEFLLKYPKQIPNVSRKKDKGHYIIGNIEITSRAANRAAMKQIGQSKDGKKRCSTCTKIKSVSKFYKKSTAKDGLHHQCKDCAREQNKKYNSKPDVKAKRK